MGYFCYTIGVGPVARAATVIIVDLVAAVEVVLEEKLRRMSCTCTGSRCIKKHGLLMDGTNVIKPFSM